MPETMRAVVKFGPGAEGIRVEDVPVPTPSAGQARVRVTATGLCGTDVHIAHDEYAHERPVVMGHEILGVVDSVGDDADADWVGRRVAMETYFSACEVCDMCRAGRSHRAAEARRRLAALEGRLQIQKPYDPGRLQRVCLAAEVAQTRRLRWADHRHPHEVG